VKLFFQPEFQALGGTVVASVQNANNPTIDTYKLLIPTLVANNPKAILAVATAGELPIFLDAWVQLGADPNFNKPSNYDNIIIFDPDELSSINFSNASLAARQFAADRLYATVPGWDPKSEGYKRWVKLFKDFYPDMPDPVSQTQATSFDSWIIMSLAMTRANSTDANMLGKVIVDVMNPPGTVYYVDQYKEARAAILRGEDINYEGTMATDLDDYRNGTGGIMVSRVMVDGTPVRIGYITLEDVVPD
jgi:hypothetical protein